MSAMQRSKGARAEREVFALLSKELGSCVRRNVDQARAGGADCIEVPGWAIEVKRHETGFREAWWEQTLRQAEEAEACPALAYRASRQPWRVRMLLCDVVFSLSDRVTYDDAGSGRSWVEMDLPTFALIVRESLPISRVETEREMFERNGMVFP
jgi:Holliday junction resolvase